MPADTPVTVIPPSGAPAPSVLPLPAQQVGQNPDGTFTVPSVHLPALLAGGWQIVVGSGTTHVP